MSPMPSRNRTVLRRLALALAAAQLVAFALAPVIEGMTNHDRGHPTVQVAHEDGIPVHQDATCLACVLAAARARTPEPVRLVIGRAESRLACVPAPTVTRSLAPPPLPATRAPPASTA